MDHLNYQWVKTHLNPEKDSKQLNVGIFRSPIHCEYHFFAFPPFLITKTNIPNRPSPRAAHPCHFVIDLDSRNVTLRWFLLYHRESWACERTANGKRPRLRGTLCGWRKLVLTLVVRRYKKGKKWYASGVSLNNEHQKSTSSYRITTKISDWGPPQVWMVYTLHEMYDSLLCLSLKFHTSKMWIWFIPVIAAKKSNSRFAVAVLAWHYWHDKGS